MGFKRRARGWALQVVGVKNAFVKLPGEPGVQVFKRRQEAADWASALMICEGIMTRIVPYGGDNEQRT